MGSNQFTGKSETGIDYAGSKRRATSELPSEGLADSVKDGVTAQCELNLHPFKYCLGVGSELRVGGLSAAGFRARPAEHTKGDRIASHR